MNRQHVVLIQRGGEREGGDMYGILIKKKKTEAGPLKTLQTN